jgi:hypothetical protein
VPAPWLEPLAQPCHRFIVQYAVKPDPELPHIAVVVDLARNKDERASLSPDNSVRLFRI